MQYRHLQLSKMQMKKYVDIILLGYISQIRTPTKKMIA